MTSCPPSLRDDPYLDPYAHVLDRRVERVRAMERRLVTDRTHLADFAQGHRHYGLHETDTGWVLREWAPNASEIILTGDHSGWNESAAFRLRRTDARGNWEISLPADTLKHGDLYRLRKRWDGALEAQSPNISKRRAALFGAKARREARATHVARVGKGFHRECGRRGF